MKTIGLIGGMSWESTAVYYRLINQEVGRRLGGLHSAEIVIRSLDFERVVALQKRGGWDEAGDLLAGVAEDLVGAGAGNVLICTNTMHLVAPRVAASLAVPLIDIIDETARAVLASGSRRPLLLATAYTAEHGFYAERMRAHGVEVQVPDAADRLTVHRVIFDELCRGVTCRTSRSRVEEIVARGIGAGADGVILGCTEICLLIEQGALDCPTFDTTAIHAAAAVADALTSPFGKTASYPITRSRAR